MVNVEYDVITRQKIKFALEIVIVNEKICRREFWGLISFISILTFFNLPPRFTYISV